MTTSLRPCIDAALATTATSTLARDVRQLSSIYRRGEPAATLILSTSQDVEAYAAYRMPATYAVARAALQQLHDTVPDLRPLTLHDFGAGTGAVGWAALDVWPDLGDLVFFEQSGPAIALGKRIATGAVTAMRSARWQQWQLTSKLDDVQPADLATAAYVLGELTREQQAVLLATLMQTAPTVVLIEPGTPAGFARIINARQALIGAGFAVAAPCPHQLSCPMLARGDWCHFAQRLERTSLHRAIKAAQLSYEDEKFSYVAATRLGVERPSARIVRHPQLRKGLVSLELCDASGDAIDVRISKSEGARYKAARHADWGDPWP